MKKENEEYNKTDEDTWDWEHGKTVIYISWVFYVLQSGAHSKKVTISSHLIIIVKTIGAIIIKKRPDWKEYKETRQIRLLRGVSTTWFMERLWLVIPTKDMIREYNSVEHWYYESQLWSEAKNDGSFKNESSTAIKKIKKGQTKIFEYSKSSQIKWSI